MRCPFCGSDESRVKDSRPTEDGSSIRRRRICEACQSRFTTFERVVLKNLTVVKKDGTRELFDQKKLQQSINIAVNKRQVKGSTVEALAKTISRMLLNSGDSEITSSYIGEQVVQHLRQIDNVGYIRYASVYLNFDGTKDFEEIIRKVDSPQFGSRNAAE